MLDTGDRTCFPHSLDTLPPLPKREVAQQEPVQPKLPEHDQSNPFSRPAAQPVTAREKLRRRIAQAK